ncbi:hypothetical protein IC582_023913 [Cucumis melo]
MTLAYGDAMTLAYGDAGKAYIKWCAQMTRSLNISVLWIIWQQSDALQPIINTYNGFYYDNFTPNNPKSPKMFTENWGDGSKNGATKTLTKLQKM